MYGGGCHRTLQLSVSCMYIMLWRGSLIEEKVNVLHTSDEQAALGVKVEQRLPAKTFPILDHVRLVENEILPLLALEHFGIL